ncbi:Alpha-adducin Erythrocyte adducin subunit alpha [Collichthys lucidus]|uniref:Alpha-adducin n=1 Tax=Collichthys lucidus TaxID=240159 RepID=A0A4U5V9G2_COLLU|nr:Alpha-adducin Erythrocyte adducin subunit alpha [Collichthys lucidus]
MNGESGAGVVTAPPPTTAPHKERYFDRVDESNPDYQRERNMAPDLRQDFNMMEQRKRVSMILQSPAFCDELETMIQDQLKKGKTPTSLLALQQIADFMTTSMPSMYPAAPQGGMAALNMSLGMVTPVNDLRGSDSISYDKGEKLLRCKLAAFYRLTDLFGWSQLIYNHLSVRVNSEQERFLIVPFGLLYSEVTASSLVKINLQSEIVDRGSTNLGVNQAGFVLHAAIYAARPDVKCIVHIHTPAGAAVSAMKCGLLPISPEALSLGEVAYHDYYGILVDEEETVLIQRNLGPNSKVLILRNHGLVSLGETVEEAFYYIHNLVTACEIQVRTLASAGGPDNLVMLDPGKYKARPRVPEPAGDGSSAHPKWQVGEQEFEALMRMLDNLGYRTGYPYRCPALRDKAKKYSDTEIASSAHGGYSYGEDSDSGARSPLKHSFQRGQRDKTRWVNAVNEPCEDGPDGSSPKSKPKRSEQQGCGMSPRVGQVYVAEHENPEECQIRNVVLFINTCPRNVLEMRNKIREQNLQDIKTAGPQSQVLCASTVERSFNQGELVTASKAIIEKEYQPRVIVSKQGPNPFTKLTDQELEAYRKEVEQKQKGPEAPPAPTGTPATPASEQDSSSCRLSSGAEPVHVGAGSAETVVDDVFSSTDEVLSAPDSPHKEFHCAVLRALSKESSMVDAAKADQAPDLEVEQVEPEEEPKDQKPTTTPPSTPIRAEEGMLYRGNAEASACPPASLKSRLPDTHSAEPSNHFLPKTPPLPLPPQTQTQLRGRNPLTLADQDGEESPSKSPSKKKKKFRTPSFLKKNKKKTES